jgi:hypothetical protein
LIPELQGRFPIRVELHALGKDDFVRILREPQNALIKQYKALLATEGVDLDFTDEEIDAIFKQMQALKVSCFCTNQSRVDVAPRLVPCAEKSKIKPAWHPHAMVQDPNEVATPEGMERLLAMSKHFAVNLDIGHYTAGNNDALDFLKKHHDRITHLHIKDRKRNAGPNVALGTGDTPIKEKAFSIRLTERGLIKRHTDQGTVWLGLRLRSAADTGPGWGEPADGSARLTDVDGCSPISELRAREEEVTGNTGQDPSVVSQEVPPDWVLEGQDDGGG